jgi:hypothetical protein
MASAMVANPVNRNDGFPALAGKVAAILQAAGVAEAHECVQEFGDPGARRPGEALGEFCGAAGAGAGGECGAQGLELLGQGLGPVGFGAARAGDDESELRLGLDRTVIGGVPARVLQGRAQPADQAAALGSAITNNA